MPGCHVGRNCHGGKLPKSAKLCEVHEVTCDMWPLLFRAAIVVALLHTGVESGKPRSTCLPRRGKCHFPSQAGVGSRASRTCSKRATAGASVGQHPPQRLLHGTVEGLAWRHGRVVVFEAAGDGRRERADVLPHAREAAGALQTVADIRRARESDEAAAQLNCMASPQS
jgi:hypothetical protein